MRGIILVLAVLMLGGCTTYYQVSGVKCVGQEEIYRDGRKTFVSEMFKSGATGYLLKDNAFAEIVEAIHAVVKGEKYVCAKVATLLVDEYVQDGQGSPAPAQLTKRELEVIRMLANGKTSKEIALITETSVKTIDACRRRIMRKLDINSVAELVKYAIREGLTTVDQ